MTTLTIDDLLEGWEISWIEIIPCYSGEPGARGEIEVWECTISNGHDYTGSGDTILDAVWNAVHAMAEQPPQAP